MTHVSNSIVFTAAILAAGQMQLDAAHTLGWLAVLAFAGWILAWMRRPI